MTHAASLPRPTPRFARHLSLRAWLAYLVALDAAARDRAHLAGLDARMRRDIGVSAGDVAQELRAPLTVHRFSGPLL